MQVRVRCLQEDARKKSARARRLAIGSAQKITVKTICDFPTVILPQGADIEKEMNELPVALRVPEEYQEHRLFLEKFFRNLVQMVKDDGWPKHDIMVTELWADIEQLRRRAEAIETEIMRRPVNNSTAPLRLRARVLVSMAHTFDNSLEEFVITARGMDIGFYIAEVNERRRVWQRS